MMAWAGPIRSGPGTPLLFCRAEGSRILTLRPPKSGPGPYDRICVWHIFARPFALSRSGRPARAPRGTDPVETGRAHVSDPAVTARSTTLADPNGRTSVGALLRSRITNALRARPTRHAALPHRSRNPSQPRLLSRLRVPGDWPCVLWGGRPDGRPPTAEMGVWKITSASARLLSTQRRLRSAIHSQLGCFQYTWGFAAGQNSAAGAPMARPAILARRTKEAFSKFM